MPVSQKHALVKTWKVTNRKYIISSTSATQQSATIFSREGTWGTGGVKGWTRYVSCACLAGIFPKMNALSLSLPGKQLTALVTKWWNLSFQGEIRTLGNLHLQPWIWELPKRIFQWDWWWYKRMSPLKNSIFAPLVIVCSLASLLI